MDKQHTDEQGISATTPADGNTHTVSTDIDSQSGDTSLETVKTVGLPSDVVMEPDPGEKTSPLMFSGTDAHPAVSDATTPFTPCDVSTSASGDAFTSQVLSEAAPSLVVPLPPFVTSDTAPPLVQGETTAQMVSSSAHSDSNSPFVHGDATIRTDSSSPQNDLAPSLVHGNTTVHTESSGAYSNTAQPLVHGNTTAPTVSSSSLSTTPVESYLVKSPQGTKYSMTQSHVIEMDGQDVHVLVKHELSEADTREVESWMEGGGGTESGEGTEELFRLCADQAKALGEWTEGESVQGVGEGTGEGGSVTMREATSSARAGVPALSYNASRWSHADSLKLIQLYKENCHFFTNNQIKKKTVWTMLAGRLARSSKSKTKFTSSQVYNRWKNLTKTYRDCLHNNQRDGVWAGKCHFFEEMASVYDPAGSSEKPRSSSGSHRTGRKRRRLGLAPPAREGSFRAIAPKVSRAVGDKAKTCICGAGVESSSQVGGGLEGVVRAVKDLHEEEKARDEWKMARLESMHREKMDLFAQFLDVLKGQVA